MLAEIKADDNLKRMPVLIMTTSRAEEDVLQSYSLHTDCYVTEPINPNRFTQVVGSFESFWLRIVVLPPKEVRE